MADTLTTRWPEDSLWERINPNWRLANVYMQQHLEVPVAFCVLYIIVIFGGKWIMAKREAFDLKILLGFWNVLLSLFSITGAIYVIPPIIQNALAKGVTADMCDLTSEMANPWVFYFCLSKIPELLDTVFIVLRKRPLIFLHYYHHVATLVRIFFALLQPSLASLFLSSFPCPSSCVASERPRYLARKEKGRPEIFLADIHIFFSY